MNRALAIRFKAMSRLQADRGRVEGIRQALERVKRVLESDAWEEDAKKRGIPEDVAIYRVHTISNWISPALMDLERAIGEGLSDPMQLIRPMLFPIDDYEWAWQDRMERPDWRCALMNDRGLVERFLEANRDDLAAIAALHGTLREALRFAYEGDARIESALSRLDHGPLRRLGENRKWDDWMCRDSAIHARELLRAMEQFRQFPGQIIPDGAKVLFLCEGVGDVAETFRQRLGRSGRVMQAIALEAEPEYAAIASLRGFELAEDRPMSVLESWGGILGPVDCIVASYLGDNVDQDRTKDFHGHVAAQIDKALRIGGHLITVGTSLEISDALRTKRSSGIYSVYNAFMEGSSERAEMDVDGIPPEGTFDARALALEEGIESGYDWEDEKARLGRVGRGYEGLQLFQADSLCTEMISGLVLARKEYRSLDEWLKD